MEKEYTIGIIISDTETLIKKIENHDSIDSIMIYIYERFPNNNYFIKEHKDYKTYYYFVKKGFLKPLGHYSFNEDYLGNFIINDKYPQFKNDENYHDFLDEIFYDEALELIDSLYERFPNKKISIDNWKYKLPAPVLHNLFTINTKYINWLCNIMYLNNDFFQHEDYDKIKELLKDFDNPQVKAYIKKEGYSINILDYENNNELFKIINECYYSKLDDVEAGDRKILYEKRKIFEFRNWIVVTPKTHAEAVTIGRRTNWCTSGDSEEGAHYFENYTTPNHSDYIKTGRDFVDLYIFINKNDEIQKFQWSELTGDFLDWNDSDFQVNKYFDEAFIEEFNYSIGKMPFKFKKFLGKFFKDKYYNYFVLTLPESNLIMDIRNNDTEVVNILLDNINDLTYGVKLELIKNKHGLDIFINDEAEDIIIEVLKHGYGLDIFINDDSNDILMEIMRQGYGLDILKNSDVGYVGVNANIMLRQIEVGEIQPYINEYGFQCYK